jgi:hypothetical protein
MIIFTLSSLSLKKMNIKRGIIAESSLDITLSSLFGEFWGWVGWGLGEGGEVVSIENKKMNVLSDCRILVIFAILQIHNLVHRCSLQVRQVLNTEIENVCERQAAPLIYL